jgi:hypothetical protein
VRDADHRQRDARAVCEHCGFAHSIRRDGPSWHGPVSVTIGGRCSRCGRGLHWRGTRRSQATGYAPVHTIRCEGCGAPNRRALTRGPGTGAEVRDDYFGLSLWLQTECGGHVLWAKNEGHLLFLERYVAADLRERTPNMNGSLPSRLPTWIKLAKHRDEVLRCLQRLRASLIT